MEFRIFSRIALAAALALGLAACGGGGGGTAPSSGGGGGGGTTTPTVTLTGISISPANPGTLVAGTTLQFAAVGHYSNNTSAPLTSASWSSSSSWIASINASGLATGVAAGSTIITASAGGVVSNAVTLNVTNATVTSMIINPASASIGIGQPLQLAASAAYSNSTTGDVTALATWTPSNTSVNMTWIYPGLVTGVVASSVTITATYGGASAVAAVTVTNTYAVGGKLTGLPASAAVGLKDNGTDSLTITNNTLYPTSAQPFVFNTTLAPGSVYNITVASQPAAPAHPCTVVDGAGIIPSVSPNYILWPQVVCASSVSTLAGNLDSWGHASISGGFADSVSTLATTAKFNSPGGIAPDPLHAGNVYVADTGNNVIRLVAASGVVSTFAGATPAMTGGVPPTSGYVNSATPSSAKFSAPQGAVTDKSGNLYVADNWNNVIRMITPSGVVSTYAGQTPTMTGGVAAPASYVNATSPTGAQFNGPQGLALDGNGNMYVADGGNNVIRVISASGVVSTLAGATPAMTGGAPAPASYVNGAATSARFSQPMGLVVDKTNTYLYVTEWNNCTIRQVTIATGAVATVAGALPGAATLCGYADGSTGSALFYGMGGNPAFDASGNLYVADTKNGYIREIIPGTSGWSNGTVTTLAGTGIAATFADGPPQTAGFDFPAYIIVDQSNSIIIADRYFNLIRKYSP